MPKWLNDNQAQVWAADNFGAGTSTEITSARSEFDSGMDRLSSSGGASIRPGAAQRDKFEAGIRTALINRCLDSVAPPNVVDGEQRDAYASRRAKARADVFPASEQSVYASEFENSSLFDLAREFVEGCYGIRSREFSREAIAIMALFGPQRACEALGISMRDAGAIHTTGSFANLTLDAINKSMMLGYTEAPSTWERVFRVGADADNFRDLNRVRLGNVPNIPVWSDNDKPRRLSVADGREPYAVEARSASIDFSYRLLVNDDMGAISRMPGQLGNAMRRTINALAWSVVTSNPTMSDNVALFSGASGARKRPNLLNSGAPSTTTLQTLTSQMMQMRGENTPEGNESPDVLSIQPRTIAGPSTLRTTIVQLVLSVYDASSNASLAYNMASDLTPVIEPLLDASSQTAWYLFADPSQIDTVEVTFLRGQRNHKRPADSGPRLHEPH